MVDIKGLPPPEQKSCNVLPDNVCEYVLRDTFTVVLAFWLILQLVWVTMLLVTQLVLIARGQTTWESMRGNAPHASRASEATTSALTAGSTSLEGAELSGAGISPSPAAPADRRVREGCFVQWKKLLGLDSFVATASGQTSKRRNPFSRGVITNCADFWCDPAPYFRRRANGAAMLDGEVVTYTNMYETPSRMKIRRPSERGGGLYHRVGSEDAV